ncbi:MAG: hypothetical protein DRP57_02685 [Spirochaetes bacterium]|nr:MAG: hypothetical protein DRP57_02685 [Spirochaetota bacterium]
MVKNAGFALVQSRFVLSDYLSEENFHNKIRSLFSRVFTADKTGAIRPVIVVFPELTGLWIPVLTGLFKKRNPVEEINRISKVILARLKKTPLKALMSFITGQKFSFAFYESWEESYRIWITPFVEAARRYNTYVCPGSMFMPQRDWEVSKGAFTVSKRIYNTSLLISPKGKVIGVSRKVNITGDEKKLGIKEGSVEDLFPLHTEIGKIGTLVCLDGFYDSLVARLDNFGCELVIQPSANPKKWLQIPRRGIKITQEEEWLSFGIGGLVQERESIVYALNPMGVSAVFNHRDEGRSSAWVNLSLKRGRTDRHEIKIAGGRPDNSNIDYKKYRGLYGIAESCDGEEVVYGGF